MESKDTSDVKDGNDYESYDSSGAKSEGKLMFPSPTWQQHPK